MMTDERKQIIVKSVFTIFCDNGFLEDEIHKPFQPDGVNDKSDDLNRVAEQIIALFIGERLTIEEGVEVFRAFRGDRV